ncbi:MAG TPA: YciI family protein [Galbitalea sp.]|jgi:hypothetical protein
MQYMLVIYGNFEGWRSSTQDDFDQLMAGHHELQEELTASGEFLGTSELPLDNAKVVRTGSRGSSVLDGPLDPSGDIVAGYYLVECNSVDRATEIAKRLADIEFGLIEVRQTTRNPVH